MVPLRYKEDFTNIFLVFDYERHDTNFSEDKIIRMQNSFMDSTDMGKLYINYPMIESYQHLCSLPDRDYSNRKISVSLQPGKKYKSLVRRESVIEKFIEFLQRVDDILKKHFEISDDENRKECCEKLLALKSEEDMNKQIHSILSGIIKEKWAITANYQLEYMIKNVKYAKSGQTYWNYMRDIFRQIILAGTSFDIKGAVLSFILIITALEQQIGIQISLNPNLTVSAGLSLIIKSNFVLLYPSYQLYCSMSYE